MYLPKVLVTNPLYNPVEWLVIYPWKCLFFSGNLAFSWDVSYHVLQENTP